MNNLLNTSSEEGIPNWQLVGFRATLEGLYITLVEGLVAVTV